MVIVAVYRQIDMKFVIVATHPASNYLRVSLAVRLIGKVYNHPSHPVQPLPSYYHIMRNTRHSRVCVWIHSIQLNKTLHSDTALQYTPVTKRITPTTPTTTHHAIHQSLPRSIPNSIPAIKRSYQSIRARPNPRS